MSHTKNLLLVRHGESEWNAAMKNPERWTEADKTRTDHEFGLTGEGELQAGIRLAATLRRLGIAWDQVYTSTLPRAYDTGRLALPKHAAKIVQLSGLDERNWGEEARRQVIEAGGERPDFFKEMVQDYLDTPPPGAQSLREFKDAQVAGAVADVLFRSRPEENIAIASHGETTIAALWSILGLPDDVVRDMQGLQNVNGVVLSSVEPETGEQTDTFRYGMRINPLVPEREEFGAWHELTDADAILAIMGSRSALQAQA